MKRKIIFLSAIVLMVSGVATAFAGGDGSASDPYQVENWNHLDSIFDDNQAHYILTADIDENSAGYDTHASSNANGGDGWNPREFGGIPSDFLGTVDGQGHTISGLYIDRTSDRIGLFSSVGQSTSISGKPVVSNIHFEDVDIQSDGEQIGTVAGVVQLDATVENISVIV
mgnify:CR=1 FL=1